MKIHYKCLQCHHNKGREESRLKCLIDDVPVYSYNGEHQPLIRVTQLETPLCY